MKNISLQMENRKQKHFDAATSAKNLLDYNKRRLVNFLQGVSHIFLDM